MSRTRSVMGTESTATDRQVPITAVPVRHPGRWVAAAAIVVLVAMGIHGLVTNKNYQWHIVGNYFFSRPIVEGLELTLELTAVAMVIGAVLGAVLAVMRLSTNPIVSGASWIYIWVFRGTPVLVQLLVWFNLAAIYPTISLGVPFGPSFVSGNANSLISPRRSSVLA
jgi:polar amino acid transport system permease protein